MRPLDRAKCRGGSHFTQGVDEIVIMSRERIEFGGDFIWESEDVANTRLVVMSADRLTVKEGVSLRSATSDWFGDAAELIA